MSTTQLKHAVTGLLLGTGVFHLVVAFFGSDPTLRTPLAVFGVAYFALGVWTRTGGRTAMLVAMLVTATGIGLGGVNYLQNGGPLALPFMFAIDVAVLAFGGLWLKRTAAA